MEDQINLRFTKAKINTKDKAKRTQNNNQGHFLPLYTCIPKDLHKKEKKKKENK